MKTFRKMMLAVVVCLAVGLLLSAPVTAKTTVTDSERSYQGSNPCTGADMLYNYQNHNINGYVEIGNRIHSIHIVIQEIDAEDADGNIYSGKAIFHLQANVSQDQAEENVTQKVTLMSDTGPDITLTYKERIVINANGDRVIDVPLDVEQECTP
jgi:hypothetical protein